MAKSALEQLKDLDVQRNALVEAARTEAASRSQEIVAELMTLQQSYPHEVAAAVTKLGMPYNRPSQVPATRAGKKRGPKGKVEIDADGIKKVLGATGDKWTSVADLKKVTALSGRQVAAAIVKLIGEGKILRDPRSRGPYPQVKKS